MEEGEVLEEQQLQLPRQQQRAAPGSSNASSYLFQATDVAEVEQAVILRAHASTRALGFSFPESFPCDSAAIGHCLQSVRREIQKLLKVDDQARLDFARVKEQMLMHLQLKGTYSVLTGLTARRQTANN